jgi:CheY-like chemotaxis protein
LPTPGDETIATKSLSVLICDDDEDMIELLAHYLQRAGYGLITCADSAEAIEKTLRFKPDLVLMDCNLPGIGGVAATRELRVKGFAAPVVALTASKLGEAEQRAFTQVFRKPVPMQDLLTEIKRLTH